MRLKPFTEKKQETKIGICSVLGRIPDPDPLSLKRIRGSGSASKRSGSETLLFRLGPDNRLEGAALPLRSHHLPRRRHQDQPCRTEV